jgi:hypothetical protein
MNISSHEAVAILSIYISSRTRCQDTQCLRLQMSSLYLQPAPHQLQLSLRKRASKTDFRKNTILIGVSSLTFKLIWSSNLVGVVNAPDADITFQSVDGIMYRIHRKNLECSSAAFPAAEFESKKDEVVPMPEHSEVLDLLFTFMYPERQPNLKKISFRVLADLAEAAEKYEVFSAIATCNTHMVYVSCCHCSVMYRS